MSSPPNPTLKLYLTPKCNDSGTITSLSANLTIGGLYGGLQGGRPFKLDEPVFVFTTKTGNSDSGDVTGNRNLRVEDGDGPVNVHVKMAGTSLAVHASREIHGNVSIAFDTCPQTTNENNFINLRQENGGLLGIGGFLPRPYAKGTYDITITSDTPQGIRVVTSLGENTISTTGTENTLQKCMFMIGKIHSFPADSTPGSSPSSGTYWLSELPPPLDALKDFCSLMFPHLSKFFKDENGSYRTFLAKSPSGMRSTPFLRSSLIEYDEETRSETDWELVRLLNKSMIQSWTQLDSEDDGTPNDWFSEGMSAI